MTPPSGTLVPLALLTLGMCGRDGPVTRIPPDTFGRWPDGDSDVTDTADEDTGDTDEDTDPDTDTPAPQAPVVLAVSGASAVGASEHNTCVLVDASVRCFGSDAFGVVSGAPDTATHVSVGWDAACATNTGALTCWGDDLFGLVSGAPSGTFTSVSVGGTHACAVTSGGGVTCWGSDVWDKATVPDDLPPASAVAAGARHTCALVAEGVTCWGAASAGRVDVTGDFAAVTAGHDATCAVDHDGTPTCWGIPAPVGPVDSLALGRGGFGCATAAGLVGCFGTAPPPPPLPRAGDPWVDVAVGTHHACARSASGTVTCFGPGAEQATTAP